MDKGPTKKHRDFVSEPIGEKPVHALPGVGPKNAAMFEKNGITKARHVLGTYISSEVDKDKDKFRDAIQPHSALNSSQYEQLYTGLKDYSEQQM